MEPDTSGSLKRLDVLVGEWETDVPGAAAEGRTTFEWPEASERAGRRHGGRPRFLR